MKLSAITDEISQDFEHALDVMLEYDVRYAELRGLWDTNIADLSPEQAKQAKDALDHRGMSAVCLATPIFKCDLSAEEASIRGPMHLAKARGMSEQMEILRRCSELAHFFGTDLIRVFSFWREGSMSPDIERRIVDSFAEPVEIAESLDVRLGLENEHACFIGTAAESARVISEVDSPRLAAVWDPGNAYLAGETPFPDGYEAIKPFLAHMHIKDAVVKPDGTGHEWTVVGEGDIDYEGHFQALRQDNYEGFISLETHYIPAGGKPEDGSRPCLAALRRRFIKD